MKETVTIDYLKGTSLPLMRREPEIEQIVSGFRFVEGPVWLAADQALIFSDIPGNALYRWSRAEGITMLKPNSYLANGNALDPYGNLITCEHGTSRVTATDLRSGRYTVLADSYGGRELNSPNDVVAKSDGSLYFTDPLPGRQPRVGIPRAPGQPYQGIYRYDDRSSFLYLLDDSFTFPNGLCFSDDESWLFVSDSVDGTVTRFGVDEKGFLQDKQVWGSISGGGPGCVDGMKYHPSGHIFCTGPGGIYLLDPEGKLLGRMRIPEVAANLAFNEDYSELYITATSSIYRIAM